ncbi:TetR/AcrR family transcriptional regulator [Acidaminobacter sp. JC074]|uniref:TetR/AcrR family transcriptional regulator n=1 Tax=Acidaminobacter sp. JC074 TaxID=2530199 RepID=UPI001F11339E|nr:TetR/AcrR family transcriptional regulator [Acidaminobacter sp. JC074]
MDVVFKASDLEKRDRIINAALEEFSINDFEKASTNMIVKRAKVSKGLLYHYFSSKKELYDYLVEFVFITIGNSIKDKLDDMDSDFFVRIRDIAIIKMNIMQVYPKLYDFSVKLLREMSYEVLLEKSKAYNLDLFQKVYFENIDYTLFKEDIDVKRAMEIIRWTIEKFGENINFSEEKDMAYQVEEINKYMEILRKAFYK